MITTALYRVAAMLAATCAFGQNASNLGSTANPKDWIQAFNGKPWTGGHEDCRVSVG